MTDTLHFVVIKSAEENSIKLIRVVNPNLMYPNAGRCVPGTSKKSSSKRLN